MYGQVAQAESLQLLGIDQPSSSAGPQSEDGDEPLDGLCRAVVSSWFDPRCARSSPNALLVLSSKLRVRPCKINPINSPNRLHIDPSRLPSIAVVRQCCGFDCAHMLILSIASRRAIVSTFDNTAALRAVRTARPELAQVPATVVDIAIPRLGMDSRTWTPLLPHPSMSLRSDLRHGPRRGRIIMVVRPTRCGS